MSIRHAQRRRERSTAHEARIVARPTVHPEPDASIVFGLSRLRIPHAKDALLYVPGTYSPETPIALALMLHGAGGLAEHRIGLWRTQADEYGIIVIAAQSQRPTWDMIAGGYGPDIEAIDHALDHVFEQYAVDHGRVAIGGFSDGASYALSVGVTNGDLFTHIVAFSPGYLAPRAMRGNPQIYISHGASDKTLPIDRCSRRIVPNLREAGYDVTYHEFEGPHSVPESIAGESANWFITTQSNSLHQP
jgi:predicted esterase